MTDEAKVYISPQKNRKKTSYRLRWVDPASGRWRSKTVGTDSKRAEHERALLQDQLEKGTYRHLSRITWQGFIEDHVAKIPGGNNAGQSRRILEEFGRLAQPAGPRSVTFTMIERYVAVVHEKGNAPATINKKLRYVRAALNKAVKRGYAARSPMDTDLFRAEEAKPPRIVTGDEENHLLDKAEELYGIQFRTFIYATLNTGGRHAEMLGLAWDRMRLDGDSPDVRFVRTKSHRDRIVPIDPSLATLLRRLQPKTLQDGGPFVSLGSRVPRMWRNVRAEAGVDDVTVHDLRRTYITRLIQANVPLPTVQKLAGHSTIITTLRYYSWVSTQDMRDGVRRLAEVAG